MKKPGRNDPCPCGSGKKFKKCCESKMIGGRFKATKIDVANKTPGLTSLFHTSTSAIPKKTTPPSKEQPDTAKKTEDPQP